MINSIINILKQQACEHKAIKSFTYNRTHELGSGKQQYPLFWLEDPIYGRNEDNIFTNSLNFSILFIPSADKTVLQLQNLAFSAGLNIIERIKLDKTSGITIKPDWTYITLRDYYDDNTCGCRFSINYTQVNMQNLCLIHDQFDAHSPQPETTEQLADFDLNTAGSRIFVDKLPQFDIKTRK